MRNNIWADMIPQKSGFVWLVGYFIAGILLIDIMPFRLPTAIYLRLILGVILLICDVLIFNQSGFYYYSKLVLLFFLLGLSVSGLHINLNNTAILNSGYTGAKSAQIGLIEKYDHNKIRLTVALTIRDTEESLQALRKLRIWSYDTHDFNTGDIFRIYGKFFLYHRQVLQGRQLRGFDLAISGISSAWLVGKKKTIPREVYNSFHQSGIARLLTISGLHMGFSVLEFMVYAVT